MELGGWVTPDFHCRKCSCFAPSKHSLTIQKNPWNYNGSYINRYLLSSAEVFTTPLQNTEYTQRKPI